MASGVLRRLLCLALPGLAAAATLSLETLRWSRPDAQCMDGSPSGYYWQPARTRASGLIWIVYLEAGGWCNSKESCEERCALAPALCSSRNWDAQLHLHGIFSDEGDNALAAANKVYVRYCTSDAHMGDAAAFGFQFRGERVVRGVLEDLVLRRGLGRGAERETLIFGGASAGARGAMVHLDYVSAMLGASAAANVAIFGFLDSPVWLDVPPLNTSFEGFANMTEAVFGFANVSHLGTRCEEAYGPEQELWKCIFGEFRLPLVQTRYMVIGTQYDGFQLNMNMNYGRWLAPSAYMKDEDTYALEFARKTREFMRSLEAPNRAVYCPACYSHATSRSDSGFERHTCGAGVTAREALLQFLGLSPLARKRTLSWIDDCDGTDCGRGCHTGEDGRPGVIYASAAASMPCVLVTALAVLSAAALFLG